MPNYRRIFIPGGTYFFTVNLFDRRSRLLTENIDALRAAYGYVAKRHPFATVAICILPEHLHCVWRLPPEDHDYSLHWRLIKSHFSKSLSSRADLQKGKRLGERGIWQRRFWEHAIRDASDLDRHVNYIHFNPVKHGLAKDPDYWPRPGMSGRRNMVGPSLSLPWIGGRFISASVEGALRFA